MALNKILAGFAAAALTISPTVAAAQTAVKAPTQLAPAEETVEGSELGGGFLIPLLVILAIIAALVATDVIDLGGDDAPVSK